MIIRLALISIINNHIIERDIFDLFGNDNSMDKETLKKIIKSLQRFLSIDKSKSINDSFGFMEYLQDVEQYKIPKDGKYNLGLLVNLVSKDKDIYKYDVNFEYKYTSITTDVDVMSETLFYKSWNDYYKNSELILSSSHKQVYLFKDKQEHVSYKPKDKKTYSILPVKINEHSVIDSFCKEISMLF